MSNFDQDQYAKFIMNKQAESDTLPVYQNLIQFINTLSRKSHVQAFTRLVIREHRTLQQSLVRLCMEIIIAVGKQEETSDFDGRNELAVRLCADITKEFGDRMDSLPLI